MSERFKEAVLKTVVPLYGTVGSNPTPSARYSRYPVCVKSTESLVSYLAFILMKIHSVNRHLQGIS